MSDKKNNVYLLCPAQSYFLWKTSFCSMISSLYAFKVGYYDTGVINGCVFLSSIYYWQNPNYSHRRYLDMGCVYSALGYHLVRAYNAQYSKIYYTTLFTSICFYPLGIYLYNKKLYWYSTYSHSMLHILANVANIILYSGYIEPLTPSVITYGVQSLAYAFSSGSFQNVSYFGYFRRR